MPPCALLRRLAPAAVVLAGGCSQGAELSTGATEIIQTDRASYVAVDVSAGRGPSTYAFTIVARYTNRTGAPVRLGRCSPDSPVPVHDVALVGARAGEGSAFSPVWGCPHGPAFVVQPGATRIDTLRIQGPTVVDGKTGRPSGRLEGRMRLVYDVGRSNVFEVRLP
jgi:hypothetical protein